MKRPANQIFLLLFFVTVAFRAYGQQITLTAANMPTPGIVIANRLIDPDWAAKLDPGTPGAGRSWDFSNPVTVAGEAPAVVTFVLPDATPYSVDFSQAGLASRDSSENTVGFTYFQSNNNQFSLLGVAEKDFQIHLSSPLTVFKFPVNYQNTYDSNVNATLTGDLSGDGIIRDTTTIDAWGTVLTPLGSFQCLRVKRLTIQNLTILGFPLVNRIITYEWWTSQYKAPVFTHTTESATVLGETETDVSAEYLTAQTSSLHNPESFEARIETYPNPATHMITLKVGIHKTLSADLYLYDAQGRLVRTVPALQFTEGYNLHPISVAALVPGNYLALLAQSDGVLGLQQFVVAAH